MKFSREDTDGAIKQRLINRCNGTYVVKWLMHVVLIKHKSVSAHKIYTVTAHAHW